MLIKRCVGMHATHILSGCGSSDHVRDLRSGAKYVGLVESSYLAELLDIPIAYYTPNSNGDGERWELRSLAHQKYREADLDGLASSSPIAHLLFVHSRFNP